MPDAATPSPEPTPQSTAEVAARTCPELVDGDVRLRLHTPADVPAVVATSNDPVTVHWTTVPQPYDEGAAAWWVGHMHEGWALRAGGDASGVMGWAVDARDETGQWVFAGQVEVRPIGGGVGEMGLVLHPDHRGRGLMVPAAAMAMRWATEHGGLRVLHWKAAVGNWASRRTGWRLGYRFSDAVPGLMPQERATFDGWIGTWEAGDPIEPRHPWHVPATLEVPAATDATGRELPPVRLRAWTEADRPVDPEPDELGDRFMPGQMPPSDEAGYERWLTRQRTRMATGEMVAWAIVDPTTDRVGGHVQLGRLGHPFRPGAASVGYSLYPHARGRGLLHAALVALADHAFTPTAEGGLGLARLEAVTHDDNHASMRVLQKAGFRKVGGRAAGAAAPQAGPGAEAADGQRTPGFVDWRLDAGDDRAEQARRTEEQRRHPVELTASTRGDEVLTLSALTTDEADLARVVEACRDPETVRWLGGTGRFHAEYSPTDAREYAAGLALGALTGSWVGWAVRDADGQVLGMIDVQGIGERNEIGYWVHPGARRRGVVSAALQALTRHALAPREAGGMGLARLTIRHAAGNTGSRRAIEAAGFHRIGTARRQEPIGDGTVVDHELYDLLPEDLEG